MKLTCHFPVIFNTEFNHKALVFVSVKLLLVNFDRKSEAYYIIQIIKLVFHILKHEVDADLAFQYGGMRYQYVEDQKTQNFSYWETQCSGKALL